MISITARLSRIAVALLYLAIFMPAGATEYDLNGLYLGKWTDRGRNIVRNNFRIRITHEGDRITGVTTDNTIRLSGLLVENKVFLEWDHSSGNYGEGVWDVSAGGNRLTGTWDSKGSGEFYGEWDLVRQF